jgi:hypothetical protein
MKHPILVSIKPAAAQLELISDGEDIHKLPLSWL